MMTSRIWAKPGLSLALTLIVAVPISARSESIGESSAFPDTSYSSVISTTRPAQIQLRGHAEYRGPAPLEVPAWLNGRYSITVEGAGLARTQGVVFLPDHPGDQFTMASDPPGMSAGLLVRSLNVPGIPNISAHRLERGLTLTAAGAGAGFAALNAHIQYRDRLREFGGYAADRAANERHARNGWFTYGLAVWGVSAVDYWIRPRLDLESSTPGHSLLSVPAVTRGSVAWRSIIVPGAGQEFANHSIRGSLWLAAFLGAGAGYVIADNRVNRNQTELNWARVLVDSAGPSERPQLVRDVGTREHDLQSSKDLRHGFRLALYGAYVANVVDALVMPLRHSGPTQAPRLSATFPVATDRAAVALHLRF